MQGARIRAMKKHKYKQRQQGPVVAAARPDPDHAAVIALFNETSRLAQAGDRRGAIQAYQSWLHGRQSQWLHAVWFNLGVAQMGNEEMEAAEHSFRRAIELHPGFLQALFNLGAVLEKRDRLVEAIETWATLLEMPDSVTGDQRSILLLALNNSGRVLETRRIYGRAEALLTRSLRLDPDQPQVLHHLVHLRQKQCAWPVLKELPGITPQRMIECTSALAMLDLTDDPALQLAAARRYVEEKVDKDPVSLAPVQGYAHQRVRVGYLSSDLCLHPVAMLMVELLERHDREHFEVYAFSWSREDGSDLRRRVRQAVDHYVPIGAMTDEQAAACIREHEIDVLIDLQGLTSGARANILARRPAPHQVAYLGFPGTSGMPFMDHVLCDSYVLPPDAEHGFTERPLRMPQVFQVCDTRRPVGATPTRAQCGLPETGAVFCAFNNNHKITPELFATWLRILQQVPGSVLWMLADNESVRPNLQRLCEAHGVAPERLVYAERALPPDYLARYRLADLFLDCFPFNGGTTANDALWMGVPVLTRSGRSFASRMAGSLLHHLGLPELVVDNFSDYERLGVALGRSAGDPAGALAGLRSRLEAARGTARLFDTAAQARDLEDLLLGLLGRRRERPAVPPADSVQRVFNYRGRCHAVAGDPVAFDAAVDAVIARAPAGTCVDGQSLSWGLHNSLFDDEVFRRAWGRHMARLQTQHSAWACHLLAGTAFNASQLDGAFLECAGDRPTCLDFVLDTLPDGAEHLSVWLHTRQPRPEGLHPVRMLDGPLGSIADAAMPARLAWLHLNLPWEDEVLAAVQCLFDCLVPGGQLLLSDYEKDPVQRPRRLALDAWLAARHHRVLPLPTGQGLLIKQA